MTTRAQVMAARAAVEAEIATLDPLVGVGSAYALALADGTRAMPRELDHLFSRRVRWEKLTTSRRRWQAADGEASFAAVRRENDR